MRRTLAVGLICILGSLLGRVSAQSSDATAEPVITQDAPVDFLTTPEIILTDEAPEPTDIPTLIPSPIPLPTIEVTSDVEVTTVPSQAAEVEVILPTAPADEGVTWDLSVRELFEDAPESPWMIPSQWTLDANQRLASASQDAQEVALPPVRYEASLGDVQAQAAFFLSEGEAASLAVRVTESGAYTAELDATGAVRLLRAGAVVAENSLSLISADSHVVNVMIVGGTITVRVDGAIALTYSDLSPLAAGAVELGGHGSLSGGLVLDDVFIWLPQMASPVPIVSPTLIPLPTMLMEPTAEATAESLPASADTDEVSAQGVLLIDAATQYTMNSTFQQTWTYTLPGPNTNYYIEIERVAGDPDLVMDIYALTDDTGHKIAFASPEGHAIVWVSHSTGGTKSFLAMPRNFEPGKSATFEITVHSCCKPRLFADEEETYDKYESAGYIYASGGPGVAHWAYELTTPTDHFLDWERTEGNLSYRYTIRYRSTGAIVSQGNVLADLDYPYTAMYVPYNVVGWYDVELTLLKDQPPPPTIEQWTQGSYWLGLFYGNPYPPKPTGFTVTNRDLSSLSFSWNADATGKTSYFLLQRRPYLGASYYDLQGFVEGDEVTISEDNLVCGTTYEYRLQAYNWASPSTYDGDVSDPQHPQYPEYPDAQDIEEDDISTAPMTVATLGCRPPNDKRSTPQILTLQSPNAMTQSFEYGPNTDLYVSSAFDNTGDPALLSCLTGGFASSLWYRYNSGTVPGILKVTTADSTYDTVIAVYQNVGGQLVEKACHDDVDLENDNTTSQVIYETVANQQYFIMVANWGAEEEYLPVPTDVGHVHFSLLMRPPAPTLLAPINLGFLGTSSHEMIWNSVPASTYHIQVAAANTFANRLIDEYQAAVSFDDILELPDGSYFWRVRAINPDGITGNWSTIWSYTKDTVAPPVPTISVPVANAVFTTLRPSFSASVPVAAGAKRYEWQIATDTGFTPLVATDPTFAPTAAFTLKQSLAQGLYYARVRACDAAENCGAYTDPRPFQIDLRLLPANNASVIATTTASAVAFKWALPQGVTAFTLEVSTDEGFESSSYTHTFGAPLPISWSIPNVRGVLGYGSFYWRLVLTTPNMPDVTTTPRRFIVTPPLPAAPKLAAQPNAGILNADALPLELEWLAVPYVYGGVTYGVTYEVRIDNLVTFASPEYTSPTPISGLTHTIPPLPDGIYHAQVRTVNEFGAAGLWSTAQKITIDTVDPLAPTITAPYFNATTSNARQPTTWKPVPGATHYHVQYSRTPTFDDIVINSPDIKAPVAPAVPTYVPTISLAQGQYFARVQARDAALNWSDYSITFYTLVVNTLPTDNGNLIPTPASATTASPVFRWATVPGATQYRVHITSEDYCTNVIASSPILGPTTLAWSYAPASLGYGSYYWCVAVNRGPGTPATAALYPNVLEMPLKGFKLNIVPAVPPAVVLTYPGVAMSVKDSALTITWANMPATVLNGPFQYEVEIDNNALFNNREFVAITGFGDTSILTSSLNDGKYNLRVRAINSAGGVGPWSIVRPFTIDTIDPQSPTLLTPAQDSSVNGLLPTMTWTPVPDAVMYLVQISHTPNFSPVHEWQVKTTTTVVPFALLNQSYYVRVQAIDAAGNHSAPAPLARVFSVNWPATQAPIPVYYTLNNPTLVWEPVTWATRYEVQMSTSPTFATTTILESAITGSMPTEFDLLPRVDGIYYWRVRAGNSTLWFAWSDVITFAVDS